MGIILPEGLNGNIVVIYLGCYDKLKHTVCFSSLQAEKRTQFHGVLIHSDSEEAFFFFFFFLQTVC